MRPFLIEPRLRDYAWGTHDFIAQALVRPPSETPIAEAWFGAHPSAPSVARIDGAPRSLDEVVGALRGKLLGERVETAFGELPFLLKLLSAARPLSIQVHPTKAQAASGRRRQSTRPDKANSFADDNHKPELLVALTPFFALCGFRDFQGIARHLEELPELTGALPPLAAEPASLRAWFQAYFALPEAPRSSALLAWMRRLESSRSGPEDWRHWALAAHHLFSPVGGADAGLVFFAFLHFVKLDPGQGIFLPAGVPHAYLQGSGLEVMANSDNVLRGGLTPKPVDVEELLRVTRFEPTPPWVVSGEVLRSAGVSERRYPTAASEFELSRLELSAGTVAQRRSDGPEVLFVESGNVTLESGDEPLVLLQGQSAVVPHGTAFGLRATESARVVRVVVPQEEEPVFRGRKPVALAFGTSGLRGLVSDMTDLEVYVNTRGFLDYLVECGDAEPGASLALGGDLRPSTDGGERSILRAVFAAARDAGFQAHYFGRLPTPALMSFALGRGWASIMVTGSHIPFDRNGIKFNRKSGEVLKADEAPILDRVLDVRRRNYLAPASASPFDDEGRLRELPPLPAPSPAAIDEYIARYENFFPKALAGVRIGVYQHSAVGRDVLCRILETLGATVHPFGRAEQFVAIDTEAITSERLAELQVEVDALVGRVGPLDAIVSTDGDSDRPLVLTFGPAGKLVFQSGDRLGIVTAEACAPDSISVPVSATDAIEMVFGPKGVPVVRTKIGSPYVISAMNASSERCRVGWEANGGFLLGTDVVVDGRKLTALPTRDAVLPIVAALAAAQGTKPVDVGAVFERLPARATNAALLDQVPVEAARRVFDWFSPIGGAVVAIELEAGKPSRALGKDGILTLDAALSRELRRVVDELSKHFESENGFGRIEHIDYTDGIRMRFAGGDIAHVRASGNAPQMRVYAIANTPERARNIAQQGTRPGGILTRLLASAGEGLRLRAILSNVAHTDTLFRERMAAGLIGCVSGSESARRFWQRRLEDAQRRFGAERVLALHEDLPVNQAFGVLLAWQRLRPAFVPGQGALVSFVFGEGTRASPFTETDNGQKPAMLSFVRTGESQERYVPMAELALRYFAPVEAHLRRSGFDGLVIKWGDEVQVPSLPLDGRNPLFDGADIVRFVSLRVMDDDDARNKDWVGVDREGRVTSFIARRPLEQMERLADRGILRRDGDKLIGGVNLGSIALSRNLLDALLHEFESDVFEPNAQRRDRPDLDPQFFSALTVACIGDTGEREAAWERACQDSASLGELRQKMPELLSRLCKVVNAFQTDHGRAPRLVAMDFGEPYWGDIGQHRQIREFYQALRERNANGTISRALAGIGEEWDENGNLLVNSHLPEGARISGSVLIDCEVHGECDVEESVLIGTRCRDVRAVRAFDVDSCVTSLELEENAGSYRVVAPGHVVVARGRRTTSLFASKVSPEDAVQLSVQEDTDLRQRAKTYDVPIEGNVFSLAAAHEAAIELDPEELRRRRNQAIERVQKAFAK
jgi:phosphomannomutase